MLDSLIWLTLGVVLTLLAQDVRRLDPNPFDTTRHLLGLRTWPSLFESSIPEVSLLEISLPEASIISIPDTSTISTAVDPTYLPAEDIILDFAADTSSSPIYYFVACLVFVVIFTARSRWLFNAMSSFCVESEQVNQNLSNEVEVYERKVQDSEERGDSFKVKFLAAMESLLNANNNLFACRSQIASQTEIIQAREGELAGLNEGLVRAAVEPSIYEIHYQKNIDSLNSALALSTQEAADLQRSHFIQSQNVNFLQTTIEHLHLRLEASVEVRKMLEKEVKSHEANTASLQQKLTTCDNDATVAHPGLLKPTTGATSTIMNNSTIASKDSESIQRSRSLKADAPAFVPKGPDDSVHSTKGDRNNAATAANDSSSVAVGHKGNTMHSNTAPPPSKPATRRSLWDSQFAPKNDKIKAATSTNNSSSNDYPKTGNNHPSNSNAPSTRPAPAQGMAASKWADEEYKTNAATLTNDYSSNAIGRLESKSPSSMAGPKANPSSGQSLGGSKSAPENYKTEAAHNPTNGSSSTGDSFLESGLSSKDPSSAAPKTGGQGSVASEADPEEDDSNSDSDSDDDADAGGEKVAIRGKKKKRRRKRGKRKNQKEREAKEALAAQTRAQADEGDKADIDSAHGNELAESKPSSNAAASDTKGKGKARLADATDLQDAESSEHGGFGYGSTIDNAADEDDHDSKGNGEQQTKKKRRMRFNEDGTPYNRRGSKKSEKIAKVAVEAQGGTYL